MSIDVTIDDKKLISLWILPTMCTYIFYVPSHVMYTSHCNLGLSILRPAIGTLQWLLLATGQSQQWPPSVNIFPSPSHKRSTL